MHLTHSHSEAVGSHQCNAWGAVCRDGIAHGCLRVGVQWIRTPDLLPVFNKTSSGLRLLALLQLLSAAISSDRVSK